MGFYVVSSKDLLAQHLHLVLLKRKEMISCGALSRGQTMPLYGVIAKSLGSLGSIH